MFAEAWGESCKLLQAQGIVLCLFPGQGPLGSGMGALVQAPAAGRHLALPPPPLQVSYETVIAAYGMSGLADKAEAAFDRMRAAGEIISASCSCGPKVDAAGRSAACLPA